MGRSFDLLGDPIPEGRGQPGRTGHIATAENIKKVRLLLVAGWKPDQIAAELGVSTPTLRKHYFENRAAKVAELRRAAIAQERGRQLLLLDRAAEGGNVGAIKAMRDITEKAAMEDLPAHLSGKAAPPKADRQPKGKKEVVAERAAAPRGGWADLDLPGLEGRPN